MSISYVYLFNYIKLPYDIHKIILLIIVLFNIINYIRKVGSEKTNHQTQQS